MGKISWVRVHKRRKRKGRRGEEEEVGGLRPTELAADLGATAVGLCCSDSGARPQDGAQR